MKKIIALMLFFLTLSALMPYSWLMLSSAYGDEEIENSSNSTVNSSPSDTNLLPQTDDIAQNTPLQPTESTPAPQQQGDVPVEIFTIYCTDRSNVLNISAKDYIIGALAVEMPLTYSTEALKAQALAAYSYAAARALNKQEGAVPMDADFTAAPSQYLGFATQEDMRKMWGSSYDANYKLLEEVAESVLGTAIYYGDTPALTCYFPLSNGKTATSEHAFGVPLEYLESVPSDYDTSSPEYEQKITFTYQQVYDVLSVNFAGIDLSGDPEQWFAEAQYDEQDYLISVNVGGALITGEQLRENLGLRSTSLQVQYTEGIFVFTTQGYGHCVGMSQYGANVMAQNGHTFQEIIAYYYPGTVVR